MSLQARYLYTWRNRNARNREERSLWPNEEDVSAKRQWDLATQIMFVGWICLSDHQFTNPLVQNFISKRKSFPSIWLSIVAGNTLPKLSWRKKEFICFWKILFLFPQEIETLSVSRKHTGFLPKIRIPLL